MGKEINTNNTQCQRRLVYKQTPRLGRGSHPSHTMGLSSKRSVTPPFQGGNPGSNPGSPTICSIPLIGQEVRLSRGQQRVQVPYRVPYDTLAQSVVSDGLLNRRSQVRTLHVSPVLRFCRVSVFCCLHAVNLCSMRPAPQVVLGRTPVCP